MRYGAESNEACRATLTEGLARTRLVSTTATITESRHDATEPMPDIISAAAFQTFMYTENRLIAVYLVPD